MANEITVNATLQFAKGNVASEGLGVNAKFTMTGTNYVKKTQAIPTTAGGTALDVSGLSTLGFGIFKNNDGTNAIDLMTAVSGTVFATINPGECALIRFPSSVSAPAALAQTATCQLQYQVLEN